MTSLTTSNEADGPQPPSALRVAGGAASSASPSLLDDVPHRLRRADSHPTRRRPQRRLPDLCRASLEAENGEAESASDDAELFVMSREMQGRILSLAPEHGRCEVNRVQRLHGR